MEYVLDSYIFRYIPFTIHPNTRKSIISMTMKTIAIADWWCKTREVQSFVQNHPSLALAELVYVLLWLLTLCHAIRHGSRYLYTWIGIFMLAFLTEGIRFIDGSMDVVWHTQTTLTLMGMRTPLYLLCGVYHALFYTSYVLVRRMRLKWWGEATANGLFVLLLSFPLQVMGTKLLWWQWHDNDPRLVNKLYSTPLVVLALYAMLATSFNLSLYIFRKRFLQEKYDWKRFAAEFACVIGAAVLALCFTAIQYIIFFHILHDIFQVHSAFSMSLLLVIYAGVTLKASCKVDVLSHYCYAVYNGRSCDVRLKCRPDDMLDELTVVVVIHFLLYLLLSVVSSSMDIVSEGIHQAIGPCNEQERVFSLFGEALYRRKYFCVDDQHQKQFDFHCIPGEQLPTMINDEPLEYYAICGTDFENRMEYVTLIWTYCMTAVFIIFYTALSSGTTAPFPAEISGRESYTRNGTFEKEYSSFGFASQKYGSLRDNSIQNGAFSSQNSEIADTTPQFHHRPRVPNSGSNKGSRLPTPTRRSGRLLKSPT